MSRLGGGSSGFSLASFSISSNFLLSTSAWTLWSTTDLLKLSSRRPASPLKRATAASMSAIEGGFTCSLCRMTAEVAGSMCNSAWQHGHVTVIRFTFAIRIHVIKECQGGCMFAEFKKFIMRGNVMDLAVGVIIGAAFGKIVASLVNDIFMPVI